MHLLRGEGLNSALFQGVKAGSEGSVELGIESIQFGAPSSAGSTDSDGVPPLLETGSEHKLPAPKEQRPKHRAGPIKSQKVTAPQVTRMHSVIILMHEAN